MNLLISGRPRVGKTTACRMIMDRLDREIRGFVTEDILHEGDRVGFMVEFDNGSSRVLSHVDFDDEDAPTVGKYTVDLETMDWVNATIENWSADSSDLFIVDEIGKMELKSEGFAEEVEKLLDSETDLLATIPQKGPDFVKTLRDRDDVETFNMTEDNREQVLTDVVKRLDVQPRQP